MKFPEAPTCHNDSHRFGSGPIEWKQRADEHFRRCSYCGSIHPEDLIRELGLGASMHGSDWKFSWPHKFYVDVPNPNKDKLVDIGFKSEFIDGVRIDETIVGKREHLCGKWYNEHFTDAGYDNEGFKALSDSVYKYSGIRFEIKDVDGKPKLWYSAPYAGYQR